MATFDELEILKAAETLADEIWQYVTKMPAFARDVLGGQLARAVDSVGANIAEAYGRFHYGEKIQFLYYARGSLFEAKYWINRVQTRNLMPTTEGQRYAERLDKLARQLNTFVASLKTVRQTDTSKSSPPSLRETQTPYTPDILAALDKANFITEDELVWLNAPINQSTLTNY